MKNPAQLSIIIVNHLSEDVLDDCLRSIAASDHDLSTEVIVIDNPAGVTTESGQYPDGQSIKRQALPERVGFGEACNAGAAEAKGEYLLFLNPDVRLEASAIERLFQVLTDTTGAGIAVGRLTDADGGFQPSCRRFPTMKNLFLSRGSILGRLGGSRTRSYTLPDYSEVTAVEAAAAAMMMIPKKLFDRLGGFDRSFFMYMEDTDLCYRTARMGNATLYVPDAQGVHLWGHSTGRYRFRRIIWHHRSVWRYFVKHHRSPLVYAALGPLLTANCLLSLIIEMLTLRS